MSDLIDSVSAVASVEQELHSDKLRWKSLVHSVSAGEPRPPARVIQRLGTAFDFSPEESTAAFLTDCETLKKHRKLLNEQKTAETAMKRWKKEYSSVSALKEELLTVEQRSVEIRSQLSREWQKSQGIAKRHHRINRIENDNSRIFG